MNNSYKKYLIKILTDLKTLFGIFLSFLAMFWAFKDFKFTNFKNIIQNIDVIYVIFASIILWLCIWFRGLRWSWLFKDEDSPSVSSLYKAELIGYFGNNVLPLRLGELLRAHIIGKEYSLSKGYVVGTIILERLLDTFALAIYSLVLLLIYPLDEVIKNYIIAGGFLLFCAILVLIVILNRIRLFKTENKIFLIIKNIFKGLSSIKKNKIVPIILSTILIWSIYLFDVYLIQKAFQFNLSWTQIVLILVLGSLVIAIPSAPGMIGTFHAAIKYLMVDLFLFTDSEGNAFAILSHAYGYILLTVLGAFFFIKSQVDINLIKDTFGVQEKKYN